MFFFRVDAVQFERTVSKAVQVLGVGRLLKSVGEKHLGWIHKNFRDNGSETRWKPLSPNTIAARRNRYQRRLKNQAGPAVVLGNPQILRNKRDLERSFIVNVFNDSVSVGTPSRIAPYHQEGTLPYTITPTKGTFLYYMTSMGLRKARIVRHPGLPARPLLPTRITAERLSVEVLTGAIREFTK